MNSIFRKANNKLFQMIHRIDPDPQKTRPVTFWFYADTEEKVYHTAHMIQQKGFVIAYCGKSAVRDFLLVAEKQLVPGPETILESCEQMKALARKTGVVFDGWETMVMMNE